MHSTCNLEKSSLFLLQLIVSIVITSLHFIAEVYHHPYIPFYLFCFMGPDELLLSCLFGKEILRLSSGQMPAILEIMTFLFVCNVIYLTS